MFIPFETPNDEAKTHQRWY